MSLVKYQRVLVRGYSLNHNLPKVWEQVVVTQINGQDSSRVEVFHELTGYDHVSIEEIIPIPNGATDIQIEALKQILSSN